MQTKTFVQKVNHFIAKTDVMFLRLVQKNKLKELEKTKPLIEAAKRNLVLADKYLEMTHGKTHPADRIQRLEQEIEWVKDFFWDLGYSVDMTFEATTEGELQIRIYI